MKLNALASLFDANEGFVVDFDGTQSKGGTPFRLTFSWRSVIDQAEDIYFFGPALDGSRNYIKQFRDRTNIIYLRSIYMNLARETYGDVLSYESKVKDSAVSKNLGYNRFMVHDVWKVGRSRLEKDEVKRSRLSARKRTNRKRAVNSAIIRSVAETNSAPTCVIKGDMDVERSSWSKKSIELFPDLY